VINVCSPEELVSDIKDYQGYQQARDQRMSMQVKAVF